MLEDSLQSTLRIAFQRECRERSMRVRSLLRELSDMDDPETGRRGLHQEFDSLYGAARALNEPLMEGFFDAMRRFALHQLAASCSPLFQQGLELTAALGPSSAGNIDAGLWPRIRQLTDKIESIMARDGDPITRMNQTLKSGDS